MSQGKNNSSRGATKEQEGRVKGAEIFVGGLARNVTENMIREMFSAYGEIAELRMMKDQSGASKGFCFVRFTSKEAATNAHKEKDGAMVHGKKIGVSLSSDQDSLFFGNLRKDWSPEEFDKLVHQAFKDVVTIDLAMPSTSGGDHGGKKRLNRGFAIVQFTSHAAAARAYRLGSKPEFKLGGDFHPVIDWAEKEPELDPEEMAKIKVAFIGNLPTNADEDFLKELFVPLGKVERVALSRKGHFPVGFVHFADRSDLETAIRELDGKTIQGPQRGPSFKIQVTVAKPVEKDKKRVRAEEKNKPLKSGGQSDSSDALHLRNPLEHIAKASRLANLVPNVADPYEAAVIALPSTIKERLLRVLRLGIATRYDVHPDSQKEPHIKEHELMESDIVQCANEMSLFMHWMSRIRIDIQCIASLKKLPESAAVAVLDQFMLSGADKRDKGAYFASLVAKFPIEERGSRLNLSHILRMETDVPSKESELRRSQLPVHSQAVDRYASYIAPAEHFPYSSSHTEDPIRSRLTVGKPGEPITSYRAASSSLDYENSIGSGSHLSSLTERAHVGRSSLGYRSGIGFGSHLTSLTERAPVERPQIKYDPFTGQPYKFDPFTGEPIHPEAHSCRDASLY